MNFLLSYLLPMPESEKTSEVIILVKAAPNPSQTYGETVCCAGVTPEGNWLRLYPVNFRDLKTNQQFKRWDRVGFKWRLPKDDRRIESRRIDPDSLEIKGELKKNGRASFLSPVEVTSLDKEEKAGKSFALLRPREIKKFYYQPKNKKELEKETREFELFHKQMSLFEEKSNKPYKPCPYEFKYKYVTDDGNREGTCQDWEIDATFYKWKKIYGEEKALKEMLRKFGDEFPEFGITFAMGTHSIWKNWLINGIIRLDESDQGFLF